MASHISSAMSFANVFKPATTTAPNLDEYTEMEVVSASDQVDFAYHHEIDLSLTVLQVQC